MNIWMNDAINVKFKEVRKSVKMGQTLDLSLNFVKDIEYNDIKEKLESIKKEKEWVPRNPSSYSIRKVEGRKKVIIS